MLKVLIADDEVRICKLIQILADWNSLGMEVVAIAENGLEALRLLSIHQPDILITDIRMPGCDGLELIEKARALRPDLQMIIISGYAHFEYAKTAIQFGISDYLLKPINKQELQKALAKCGKQCRERKVTRLEQAAAQGGSREDWALLRDNLVTDLLVHSLKSPTPQRLEECYHFSAESGAVQTFVLQLDTQDVSDEAMNMIRTRVAEGFSAPIRELCEDFLLAFRDYSAYGIMSYAPANRVPLRRALRGCLDALDVRKNLFGQVQFTLALGSRGTVSELPAAFHSARSAILERITEGTGRLLDGVPKPSALSKEVLLHQYSQTVGQAVELFSQELSRKAVEELRSSALAVKSVRGRELVDLVRTAADLFTARIAAEDRDALLRDFYRNERRASDPEALFGLLSALQESLLARRIEARNSDEGRPIRLAKQYIHRHFAEPITLELVADATGFSISYFSTMFKKETGENFSKYLTRVRMEEAKTRLRETNAPVSEICHLVGYNDLKHFTHTFHKAVGLTPGEYRKLYG